MKQEIRKLFFTAEHYAGVIAGKALRHLPGVLWVYRSFVVVNRHLPDRVVLWINPFMVAFGDTLFDLGRHITAETRIMNRFRMELDISEKTQRQIYSQKSFEASFSNFILSTLHSGDTFMDVGANVGYFTLLPASLVGEGGNVISIEPESKNFNLLERNVSLNDYHNIVLYNCALGGEKGENILNINPLNHGGNSLIPFDTYSSGGVSFSKEEMVAQYGNDGLFERVSVETLDSLVQKHAMQNVAIIKIDVEGFELDVLKGSLQTLSRRIVNHILCEVNNDTTRPEVFALFKKYGYAPSRISFSGIPMPLSNHEDIKQIRGNILFTLV